MNYLYETRVIREPIGLENTFQTNNMEHALVQFVRWVDQFGDEPGIEVQFNRISDEDGEFIMAWRDGDIVRGEA